MHAGRRVEHAPDRGTRCASAQDAPKLAAPSYDSAMAMRGGAHVDASQIVTPAARPGTHVDVSLNVRAVLDRSTQGARGMGEGVCCDARLLQS